MVVERQQKLAVLLGHNTYQWPGGEDVGFAHDGALLERMGHRVVRYQRDNDEIADYGALQRARLVGTTVWSLRTQRELRALLEREHVDVAHFRNTFPLISPSAFAACRRAGVPVVLTVPNYRLTCSNAYLYRDGHVCEDCLRRRVKWPAVLHACYHDSRPQSAVVAGMLTVHGMLRTWSRHVDVVLAVSEAVRSMLVEAGLPPDLVHVRHNLVEPDPGDRAPGPDGGFALFVGRLSPEKGLDVLLEATRAVPELPLRIAGDGPERARIERVVSVPGYEHVSLLGSVEHADVFDLMRAARVLVVPSQWHEAFGHVVAEAFACGLPVVASDLGALPELVDDTVGRVFPATDGSALAGHLRWAATQPDAVAAAGRASRRRYEELFTAEPAYRRLIELYELAGERFSARRSGATHSRLRS
jgi:glycosyltransferase involved in cell wall biosynthesis